MSTISDANNYNVFTDAQQFVSQWENDEWAIDEEKGKTYTMRTPQGNVETIAHFLAGLIANFKQATTAANLWIKFGKNDLHPEVTMTSITALTNTSVALVHFREESKANYVLVPGPAHQKKVTQLEEQLSQERLARQHVERELGSATFSI